MLFLIQRHGPEHPAVVLEHQVARRPARILRYAARLFGSQQELVTQERVGIAGEPIPHLRRDAGDGLVDG